MTAAPEASGTGARTITVAGNGTGQLSFQLPPGVTLDVESVFAAIDATAAGATTATLTIAEQSGVVIANKAQSQTVDTGIVGSATWALRLTDDGSSSAGGFNSQQAQYQGNAVNLNNGFVGNLTWDAINYGTPLLDLTVPASPTVFNDGVYAVSVFVAPSSNMTVGGGYVTRLNLDDGGQNSTVIENSRPATAAAGSTRPEVALTNVWFIPAGGIIHVIMQNNDGAARGYQLIRANVVRLF